MEMVIKDTITDFAQYNQKVLTFDFSDENTLLATLDALNTFEKSAQEKKEHFEISLDFKKLPMSLRVAAMKWALTNEELIDSTLVLNILNLIKGYNTFDESFFQSPVVIVNNLEEFLDLKQALTSELKTFTTALAKYYFSIFKSAGITDFPANNRPVIIPTVYQRVLLVSDFISLSNIIRKFTEVKDLVYVENAEMFLNTLATRYVFANTLMEQAGLLKR